MKKLVALTEADGRQLAVDMLRELESWDLKMGDGLIPPPGGEDSELDATEHGLNQEPEIFRRYLAAVHRARSSGVERGFLCVLSEFIGSALGGSALSAEHLEEHIEPRPGLRFSERDK